MLIKFLGSGDALGSGGRLRTCIFFESAESKFVPDCGASALISLKQFKLSSNDIDTILITHLHGDHFGGIPFFILDYQTLMERKKQLGCKRIVLTHMSDDMLARLDSLELEHATDGMHIIR